MSLSFWKAIKKLINANIAQLTGTENPLPTRIPSHFLQSLDRRLENNSFLQQRTLDKTQCLFNLNQLLTCNQQGCSTKIGVLGVLSLWKSKNISCSNSLCRIKTMLLSRQSRCFLKTLATTLVKSKTMQKEQWQNL